MRNSWGLQFQRGAKLSCGFGLEEPRQILIIFKKPRENVLHGLGQRKRNRGELCQECSP